MGAILVFLSIVLIANLYTQRTVQTFRQVIVRAGIVGIAICVGFQVFNYIKEGFLDPFFLIAMVIQFVTSILVGTIVGISFLTYRKRSDANNPL